MTSVRLAVEHAQLRRDEQRQLSELMDSRQRLQVSADTQRARIQARLTESVASPAAGLAEELRRLSPSPPGTEGLLASAASELAAVAGEIEALTSGLRPRAMDEGLDAAMAELGQRSALTLHVDNDVATALPEAVATATYFICAEALTNAAKHAGATHAEVVLMIDGGSLVLTVRDHGSGGATLSGGTGLQGLADRVAALGGHLSVTSPLGGPTTVRATLPLSTQPQPGM
jgi:signal transduction histidine kinase